MNNQDKNNKHKNINKKEELENLEYKILEDLYIADMLNTTMDGDSAMQNLLMYFDSEEIKEETKKITKE